jgi:hypothetical protein
MEDNTLLLQIDLSSMERQLKSKTGKLEKDVGKLEQDVEDLNQKSRHMHKSITSVATLQDQVWW